MSTTVSVSIVIADCEKICKLIDELLGCSREQVERIDFLQVKSNLKDVIEQLKYVQEYTTDDSTDYTTLLEDKLEEIKAIRKARETYIRTEIFKILLTPLQDLPVSE